MKTRTSKVISLIVLTAALFALLSIPAIIFIGSYSRIQNEGIDLTQRSIVNFTGATIDCTDNIGNTRTDCAISAASAGYATVKDETVALTQRTTVAFLGATITCVDAAPDTNCTLTESSDYDTIQEEGAPLTQRSTVNFVGVIITCADSGGITVCTLTETPETSDYDTIRNEGTPLTQRSVLNFVGSIIDCIDSGGITVCTLTESSDYDTIQEEGAPLTQRSTVNFVGATVTCADSGGITVCTLTESSDYDTIQNEGTPLTQRATLNFVGSTIDCIDSGGITVCTVSGGGGGDSISVNGVAATDADFDDNTPAKPSAATAGHFQKDSSTPNNISVNILPWEVTFTSFGFLSGIITTSPASSPLNNWSPTGWNDTQPSQATIIRVTPLSSTIITGLAGGIDGRLVLIVNALDGSLATGRLIVLHNEGSSSVSSNRFLFRDRMSRFLLPGDSISFIYDNTKQRWIELSGSSWTTAFTDVCDFNSGTIASCVASFLSGTSASSQLGSYLAGNSTAKPFGIHQADTGTTATGRMYSIFDSATSGNVVPGSGQGLFIVRYAVEVVSSSAERFQIYAGFNDGGAGTSPTDGIYWLYDDATSNNWRICSEDATVQVCSTTDVPANHVNYVWLAIYVFGDWSNATFLYSNDGQVWTFPTPNQVESPNGPEAADTTGVGIGINKTVGTTQRNMDIDVMGWRLDFVRAQ